MFFYKIRGFSVALSKMSFRIKDIIERERDIGLEGGNNH